MYTKMVDVEPIVHNTDICKSIASMDKKIRAVAIVESSTIIAYYHNSNENAVKVLSEEQKEDGKFQSIIRSAGTRLANVSSVNQDLVGETHGIVLNCDSFDIITFPMPYPGNPPRILVVVLDSSENSYSISKIIQGRLEKMNA